MNKKDTSWFISINTIAIYTPYGHCIFAKKRYNVHI